MSVNKERVQLLVDALESGEFEQAHHALRDRREDAVATGKPEWGHCCLGVATEVALRNGIELPEGVTRSELWKTPDQTLHRQVMDWYGFGYPNPLIQLSEDAADRIGKGRFIAAAEANDRHTSFAEIAAGFRRQYLEE